jgi:hypothetical protein
MNTLSASKIVREVMKSHGKVRIWNNIYANGTRTVKCYGWKQDSEKLVDDIARTLHGLGVPYSVRFFQSKARMHWEKCVPSLIVRLG